MPASHASMRSLVLGVTLLVPLACSGPATPETISRDRFIEAYVGLRVAALNAGLATVDPPLRDSVLAAVGVSETELIEFASVHGDDAVFMRGVWDEITERLEEIPLDVEGATDPGG
ncbi:MAG: hypothetical protein RQ745_10325 [Longimicrobiales bacterium]|nr:hypothetical protein [Longimicrobiales bacterium]